MLHHDHDGDDGDDIQSVGDIRSFDCVDSGPAGVSYVSSVLVSLLSLPEGGVRSSELFFLRHTRHTSNDVVLVNESVLDSDPGCIMRTRFFSLRSDWLTWPV